MPDIFAHLENLRALARTHDWKALESRYQVVCEELAGAELTSRIAVLDFHSYEVSVLALLEKGVALATESGAVALYFEFDLDNAWSSGLYVCPEYRAELEGDDDWAAEFDDDIEGPDFPRASEIYRENHFDRTQRAIGATLYLVARTLSVVGRALDRVDYGSLTVCAGFHDQDPVVRLRESEI